MKKLKRPKLPKLKSRLKARREAALVPQSSSVPRITNETIAEHREAVIGSARKYIYPLQHSKHRIIFLSVSVLVVSIIAFFTYCTLALYKFNNTSTFVYRVTQVIPFPVAKAGSKYVAYENYLFELRHYIHYYETQLKLDFNTKAGKEQLAAFRQQALDKVISDAYVKELAEQNHVTVSDQQIDEQIAIVRNQNRLGSNDQVFEQVLRDYWNWTVRDFKRSLEGQILAQKVVANLDTETQNRATDALTALDNGDDFAKVARKYSDDPETRNKGGEFGAVDRTNRELTAQTVDTLFGLRPGKHSDVINIGYSLEIIKNLGSSEDGKVRGAHILFNFKDISVYLSDIRDKNPSRTFLKP